MRKINGKELKQVLKELAVSKEPDKLLMRKYPYYTINSYYERANSVIGIDHYLVEYTDDAYRSVASGQEVFSCKCRITLLDDDFNPILYKEAYGGREVHYGEKSKIDDGIKNISSNASIAAFKECWKAFGIFGIRPDEGMDMAEENDGKSTGSSNKPGNNTTSNSAKQQEQAFCLVGEGALEHIRTDKNTNLPVYVYHCRDEKNQPADVIFYPNRYKKTQDRLNRFVDATKLNGKMKLSVMAQELAKKEGIRQLLFNNFITE